MKDENTKDTETKYEKSSDYDAGYENKSGIGEIFKVRRFSELGAKEKKFVITALLCAAATAIVIIAAYLSGVGAAYEIISIASVILVLTLAVIALKMTGRKAVLLTGSIIGLLMAVAGVILAGLQGLGDAGSNSLTMMTTGGVIMFVICFAGYRKPADREIQDERSLKIGTWGMAYSWYLTFIVLILIFWLTYFGAVAFTVETVTGILIVLMPVSTIIFQRYFAMKGDVY